LIEGLYKLTAMTSTNNTVGKCRCYTHFKLPTY